MGSVSPRDLTLHATRAGSGQQTARASNPPVHPGAMHADMPRFYMLQDQRRIERAPRPPNLSPSLESVPAITFSANGWPGVRVKDILKDTVVIDSSNDVVFAHFGWRSTLINLEWPGYDPRIVGRPIHMRINVRRNEAYMTRQGFAREICSLLFDFHKRICKHPISPGWEKWAMTTGPEGIRVTDVVLLSVHYYRTFWVPELYVIE